MIIRLKVREELNCERQMEALSKLTWDRGISGKDAREQIMKKCSDCIFNV